MGSSGGGTPRAPNMPVPPGQVPFGQTSPLQPQYQSFLPTDPNAMATGLTPEMLAAINNPGPSPAQLQQEAQRNALAQAAAQQMAPRRAAGMSLQELERVFGRGSMNIGGRGAPGMFGRGGDRGSSGYGGSSPRGGR